MKSFKTLILTAIATVGVTQSTFADTVSTEDVWIADCKILDGSNQEIPMTLKQNGSKFIFNWANEDRTYEFVKVEGTNEPNFTWSHSEDASQIAQNSVRIFTYGTNSREKYAASLSLREEGKTTSYTIGQCAISPEYSTYLKSRKPLSAKLNDLVGDGIERLARIVGGFGTIQGF